MDRHGAIIDAALVTSCSTAADFGIETVAYTFFLFTVRYWVGTVINATVAAEKVQDLRAQFKPTGVPLTKQMEEHLGAWERGDMLPRAVEARTSVATTAAVVVDTIVAPAAIVIDLHEPSPAETPSAKRGLSARLASSKRRR